MVTKSVRFLSSSFTAKYLPAGGFSQTTTFATPLVFLSTSQVWETFSDSGPAKQPLGPLASSCVFMAAICSAAGGSPSYTTTPLMTASPASRGVLGPTAPFLPLPPSFGTTFFFSPSLLQPGAVVSTRRQGTTSSRHHVKRRIRISFPCPELQD